MPAPDAVDGDAREQRIRGRGQPLRRTPRGGRRGSPCSSGWKGKPGSHGLVLLGPLRIAGGQDVALLLRRPRSSSTVQNEGSGDGRCRVALLLEQRVVFRHLLLRHDLFDLVGVDAQDRVSNRRRFSALPACAPASALRIDGLHVRRKQRDALIVERFWYGPIRASMAAVDAARFLRLNSSSFWPLAKISAGVASMTFFSTSGSKSAFMA